MLFYESGGDGEVVEVCVFTFTYTMSHRKRGNLAGNLRFV